MKTEKESFLEVWPHIERGVVIVHPWVAEINTLNHGRFKASNLMSPMLLQAMREDTTSQVAYLDGQFDNGRRALIYRVEGGDRDLAGVDLMSLDYREEDEFIIRAMLCCAIIVRNLSPKSAPPDAPYSLYHITQQPHLENVLFDALRVIHGQPQTSSASELIRSYPSLAFPHMTEYLTELVEAVYVGVQFAVTNKKGK